MSDASGSSAARQDATSRSAPTADIARLNDLLQRVAHKDRDAFALLYAATSAKLFGTVLRILSNKGLQNHRGLAEDIVQEAYVNIWQKAAQFDARKASPITWLVTIARHGAIDQLRRQPASQPEGDDILNQTSSSDPDAQAHLEHQQDAQRLYQCLDELERDRREMVRLAYLDGWSRADLATQFNQPVNTIKTWLHRALKQLKGCLSS